MGALLMWLATWAYGGDTAPVVMVCSTNVGPYQLTAEGLKKQLNNVTMKEYHLNEQEPAKVLAELKANKPALICSLGTSASKLVAELADIPVVYSMVLDGSEYPTNHITGVTLSIPSEEKLKTLKTLLPQIKKLGMLYSPATEEHYKDKSIATAKVGLELVAVQVANEKDFPKAVEELLGKCDCFLMIPDSKLFFTKSVEHLLKESLKQRIPVVGLSSAYTKAGALISLEVDYADMGRQAGEMADKILKGHLVSDIKPQTARTINYSLNLSSAKRLGIKLSSEIIDKASEVFGQ